MTQAILLNSGKRRPTVAAKRPPARRRRPADRRDQILKAAAGWFAVQGFERTSVRQIADAVDMLPGSLYHHFATKEDMLHEILREPLRETAEAHQALLLIEGSAEHRLVASVQQRFRDFVDHWELNAILLNDSDFFRSRPDFAYVQDTKAASFKVQERILLDGMRERLFRPDLDVYMMIGTVARMLSSAGHWFRSNRFIHSDHPDSYTFDRVVGFHVDCVLRLVRSAERMGNPIPFAGT